MPTFIVTQIKTWIIKAPNMKKAILIGGGLRDYPETEVFNAKEISE